MQGRMHHRRRGVDFAAVRQRVPLRQQRQRFLGHDRRVADDAAGIEGRRHDAPMLAPGLAFAGQEAAAEPRLQQPAADFGFDVIRRIVQEHVTDRARLVDDEHAAPEDALGDDIGVEIVGSVSGQRIFAHQAERLPQAGLTLRLRHGQ